MLRRMKRRAYQLSQRARKKVEQVFGWLKQPGGLRRVRHLARWKIQQVAYLWAAAYNLLCLANLQAQTAAAKKESRRKRGAEELNADARWGGSDPLASLFHSRLHSYVKNHPFFSSLLVPFQLFQTICHIHLAPITAIPLCGTQNMRPQVAATALAPVASGDETRPIEGVGALALGTALAQHFTTRPLDGLCSGEALSKSSFIKLPHPLSDRFNLDRPQAHDQCPDASDLKRPPQALHALARSNLT